MDYRTEYLQIRLTPDEKRKLSELAEKNGMNISTYIRWTILNKGE